MNNNELPQEDKELIAKIDEMLTQLKGFGQSLWELREHASLVLPDVNPNNKYPDEEPNPEVIKFYDRYFKKADNEQQAIVEITEQKERWKPYLINEEYWIVSPKMKAHRIVFHNNDYDNDFISVGNCFPTKEEAERAAQAIRETLKNL